MQEKIKISAFGQADIIDNARIETYVVRITCGYVCISVTVCTVARTFVVLLIVIELRNGLIYYFIN